MALRSWCPIRNLDSATRCAFRPATRTVNHASFGAAKSACVNNGGLRRDFKRAECSRRPALGQDRTDGAIREHASHCVSRTRAPRRGHLLMHHFDANELVTDFRGVLAANLHFVLFHVFVRRLREKVIRNAYAKAVYSAARSSASPAWSRMQPRIFWAASEMRFPLLSTALTGSSLVPAHVAT